MRSPCTVLAGVLLASIGPSAGTAHAEDWQWTRGNYDPNRKMRRKHGGVAAEHATYATGIDDTRVLLQSPLLGFWYGAGGKGVSSTAHLPKSMRKKDRDAHGQPG
ncbi:MAG: hypothetical protein ACOCXM_05070 [Myxococcota bacterium]